LILVEVFTSVLNFFVVSSMFWTLCIAIYLYTIIFQPVALTDVEKSTHKRYQRGKREKREMRSRERGGRERVRERVRG
jgi:hypothetical protein